jgi:5'-nucleotidase
MPKKPLILVSNDDGISALGIRCLVEIAREFGEVVVVAPDSPQSAKSNGLTISEPLRLYKSNIFEGIESYECSGTPVDCIKLAKSVVCKDRTIDLCVSGINHGSNASINIIYSGTMSAAMEAAMEGIKAIGFSLCDFSHQADFTAAKHFARQLIAFALQNPMTESKLLNVNVPKLPLADIKGIKTCRQANGRWTENFLENKDPSGRTYYWLTGQFINHEPDAEDTDEFALANGYVSVVPCAYDLTAHQSLAYYKNQSFNFPI